LNASGAYADLHVFCRPNKKAKIPHRNVVLELMKVGEWAGGITSIPLPQFKKDGYERVAFVQGGPGGPIVAALKL
jgi:hypothetical protein